MPIPDLMCPSHVLCGIVFSTFIWPTSTAVEHPHSTFKSISSDRDKNGKTLSVHNPGQVARATIIAGGGEGGDRKLNYSIDFHIYHWTRWCPWQFHSSIHPADYFLPSLFSTHHWYHLDRWVIHRHRIYRWLICRLHVVGLRGTTWSWMGRSSVLRGPDFNENTESNR